MCVPVVRSDSSSKPCLKPGSEFFNCKFKSRGNPESLQEIETAEASLHRCLRPRNHSTKGHFDPIGLKAQVRNLA